MFCFFEFELFNLLQTSQQIKNLSSTHHNRLKSIAPTSAVPTGLAQVPASPVGTTDLDTYNFNYRRLGSSLSKCHRHDRYKLPMISIIGNLVKSNHPKHTYHQIPHHILVAVPDILS